MANHFQLRMLRTAKSYLLNQDDKETAIKVLKQIKEIDLDSSTVYYFLHWEGGQETTLERRAELKQILDLFQNTREG